MKFNFSKNTAALVKVLPTLITLKDSGERCCATATLHDVPLTDFNSIKAWACLNDLTFCENEVLRPLTRYTEVEKDLYYTLTLYKGGSDVCTFFSVNYSR